MNIQDDINYLLETCLNIQLEEDIEINISCGILNDVLGFDLRRLHSDMQIIVQNSTGFPDVVKTIASLHS